jgi:predicted negative regulator of RcsB-dependent stress response
MTSSASSSASTPAGDDRKHVRVDENYVAPSFEDRLRIFWEKNTKLITGILVVILVAIAGKGAWEYLQNQKQRDIEQAYGAATTPAQIKAFAEANPDHQLAGVAHLRMADEAYVANSFADALKSYEQAASILKSGPLASRARLGAAMSKLQSTGADNDLKTFAADAKETKAFRAEAYYHLASEAASKKNAADLKAYSDQLMQLDPASPWTQRILALRSTLPEAAADVPAPASPSITLPGVTK